MIPDEPLRRDLAREGLFYSRYLLGRACDAAHADRYAEGCVRLGLIGKDDPLVVYTKKFPWSLGPLESTAGFLQPEGVLRSKLLLLTAVLEASPVYTDHFLEKHHRLPALAFRIVALGVRSVIKPLVGLPLYWMVKR